MRTFRIILLFILLLNTFVFGARIGYLTDIHHTNRAERDFQAEQSGPRFYSESAGEVTTFATEMNKHDPDAVVEGGDFVDDSDDSDPQTDLDTIEDLFDNFSGPRYHVIGNWDHFDPCWVNAADFFDQIENGNDPCVLTLPTTDGEAYFAAGSESAADISRYYAFEMPDGVIGIVLDSTGRITGDTSLYYIYSTGLLGQGNVPDDQVTWLDDFLDNNTTVPIIVFIHHHVWPWQTGYDGDGDPAFRIVRNAETIKGLLEQHGNVAAVFSGHAHPASQQFWSDTTFAQYIDGPEINQNLHSFYTKSNGIRYYTMRSTVTGWGAGSTSTSDDDTEGQFENWGEATPASSYYLITIGRNLGDDGTFYVHAKGFGVNPSGLSDSDNMLARWKLDDEAGQTTVESTNGNQNGTSANNIVRGAGSPPNLERSMLFVFATPDYVSNSEVIVSQFPFTFAGWFKTSIAQEKTIFAINDGTSTNEYASMKIQPNGFVEMGVRDGFGAETELTGSVAYNDGRWHHITAVFTDKDNWDLYADGSLAETTSSANEEMTDDITNWSIGARVGSSNNETFGGSLADIRVWDVALAAAEIRKVYEEGAITTRSRYLDSPSRRNR